MFLIVSHHFAVHSGIPRFSSLSIIEQQPLFYFFNLLWGIFLSYCGKLGVDLFVLITGYFLIVSPSKLTSLIKLLATTIFYSTSIYIIFCLANKTKLSIETIFVVTTPIAHKQYWFVNAYILLFIFSPFLSYGLRELAKTPILGYYRYISLLLITIFFWSLMQSPPLFFKNNKLLLKRFYLVCRYFYICRIH